MKDEASDVLLDAVQCVLGGGIQVSAAMARVFIEQATRAQRSEVDPEDTASLLVALTDRELEVSKCSARASVHGRFRIGCRLASRRWKRTVET